MTTKRLRAPTAKEGELLCKYGKYLGEESLFYCYPANSCGMRRDSRVLANAFESVKIFEDKTLVKELEDRGYDITTLKFSIKKKKQ